MFEKLFKDFKEVPEIYRNDSFFEICGFPHYENVISNVLAFFLDGQNQHNMKDLVIKSLLEAAGKTSENYDFDVEREVKTHRGGFIDILLFNESACIAIENKIFSPIYNDLDDYFQFAKSKNSNAFGILLTLENNSPNHKDFINVTYDAFLKNIKAHLGAYIDSNYNKYLFLLIELLNNIQALQSREYFMNLEFIKFISNHAEEIQRLNKQLKEYHNSLRKLVNEVNAYVEEAIKNNGIKLWAYRELQNLFDTAVTDLHLDNNIQVAIDSVVDYKGWRFEIFLRKNDNPDFSIEKYCKAKGLDGYMKNNRFVLNKTRPIETKSNEIANIIVDIIKKITCDKIKA